MAGKGVRRKHVWIRRKRVRVRRERVGVRSERVRIRHERARVRRERARVRRFLSSRIPFSFVVGAAIVFFLFLFDALQFFGREFILIALQDGFFLLE